MDEPAHTTVTGLDVVRFGTELALLAGAAVAGWSIAWPLVFVGPVLVAVVWGLWIAPKASHQLPDPARLVVEIILFLAVGGALVAVGHPWFGGLLALVGVAVALLERRT
ncbi:YrdB family protein [Dermatobacter hominis]|uniref:YrdB family protein n=1 Tax=Dermatobacter hominis TaxID=2884263 RepID=UPI001D11FD58|nr:YrdB family protein [Dermatobacter hominis]UDY34521.1 YrdB family protein [Dermatobacter hominis]